MGYKNLLPVRLERVIKAVPDFPMPGIMFRDISPVLEDVILFRDIVGHLARSLEGCGNKIVGLDARGFIFGSTLAYRMKLPFVMARKKGKLPGNTISVKYGLEYGQSELEMQIGSVSKNDRVIIIDDLLATGGSARAACDLVERMGGTVTYLAFIIKLEGLGSESVLAGRPIYSLVSY
jgi:adenine phosphoribosyltransferase